MFSLTNINRLVGETKSVFQTQALVIFVRRKIPIYDCSWCFTLATFSISWNYFFFQYIVAKEQARLHEQFDAHLASGVLDHYLSKVSSSMVATMPCIYMYLQMITSLTCWGSQGDAGSHGDALKAVLNDSRQFSALDHDLIKLSFEVLTNSLPLFMNYIFMEMYSSQHFYLSIAKSWASGQARSITFILQMFSTCY
jgi:hypothetical protein